MAVKFLMTVVFTKQGSIKGSSTRKQGDLDFSLGLECHGFEYETITPTDPGSSGPRGKRPHNPIRITREVDSASPKLLQALVTNELFKSATLRFPRIGPLGKPSTGYTIGLTNGNIVKIKSSSNSKGKMYEILTLAYDGLLVNGVGQHVIPPALIINWGD